MGLFGRKVKFDGEEPVVQAPASLETPAAEAPMAPMTPIAQVVAVAAVAPQPQPPRPAYGVEEAIRLLRTLPTDRNAELVVRVVKQTLESLNVRIADIIGDAERKEATIQQQIATFKQDIAELETAIQGRREEIGRLEADLAETMSVKQRLRHAESAPGVRAAHATAG
jgi:hypothetical protein